MSAIFGYVSFEGTLPMDLQDKMGSVYEKKCKIDRLESLAKDSVFMGCAIQYITKEAEREELPYWDAKKGYWFTADCLLDNREELIRELSEDMGQKSVSENKASLSLLPDGTLMRLAYEKWGQQCLTHFRGLFSAAVYEPEKKTLFLAADPVASRCLYYYRTERGIAFSTLIAPILKLFPEIGENELYMKDFLTAPGLMPNIASSETPYEGVYKLNPGSYRLLSKKEDREIRYWEPEKEPSVRLHSAKAYGKHFRKLYDACVGDALRTNGGVGIAMSSGFDSASVGALAALRLQKDGKDLQTYTYVPVLEATKHRARNNVMNEQKDVEEIVSLYPNMRPHFLNNEGKNCLESTPQELEIMEIPFKAYVNMPNLCEIYRTAAAEGCKVLLTGQCGNSTVSHGYIDDVLFDLYKNGHYLRFLCWLNRYSKTVKESRKKALKGCIGYFNYSKKVLKNREFSYRPDNVFLSEKITEHYPLKERYQKNGVEITERIPTPRDYYCEMLYKDAMYTYLGELETKMGLFYGLIIRDATKDARMLGFCYHLPYRYFAYRGIPRWLIRGNLSDLLPETVRKNWLRYAVQNGDCLSRMERDREKVLSLLQEWLSEKKHPEWVNEQAIADFLQNLSERKITETGAAMDNLVYLAIAELLSRMK